MFRAAQYPSHAGLRGAEFARLFGRGYIKVITGNMEDILRSRVRKVGARCYAAHNPQVRIPYPIPENPYNTRDGRHKRTILLMAFRSADSSIAVIKPADQIQSV
jgi:hypothetical protein